jgi:ribonuclease P protein component
VHAGSVEAVADEDRRAALPRARRLRRPREFAAVLAADGANSIRGSGGWLSMTAAWEPAMPARARVGITVGKRMARRAIDRALVKRIVREAFRTSVVKLERRATAASVRVDIGVRLKRPLGLPGDPQRPALTTLRRALRGEADRLLASVVARLAQLPTHA